MQIKRFIVGALDTNCYCVNYEDKNICIDPGFGDEELISFLKGKKLDYIILTHHHIDHILGFHDVMNVIEGEPKVIIHKNDYDGLNDPEQNGAGFIGIDFKPIDKISWFAEDEYELFDGCKLILSSGHTEGSILVYFYREKILFSGDTVFASAIGRTDLPGSDPKKMISSLRKVIMLPHDVKVYPGHGASTTIGKEIFDLKSYCEI